MTADAKAQGELVFARPTHPLGPCGDPLSASVPDDIEWRIRRIAGQRGLQSGRFLADVLCTLFGTEEEREILRKHGRIVEEFLPDYLGKNSGGAE